MSSSMKSCHANKRKFPFHFSFEYRLRVSLGLDGDLTMVSRIRNIDSKPFRFSFAHHTYFSVSDIR